VKRARDERNQEYRVEHDTLGEVAVPADALFGAQTQRAVENFPVSGLQLPPAFLHSLATIKGACAAVNRELGCLDPGIAKAIEEAAEKVASGAHDDQFPVDVFQTGSGTSTNMNMNEVLATLASRNAGQKLHPNDHVNRSQSSNDVIPTAIHVSACREIQTRLLPTLEELREAIDEKSAALNGIVKTGRTHLMDALPIRMGQELSAWSHQVTFGIETVHSAMAGLSVLAIGGTAVGTGANAPAGFGVKVAARLAAGTGLPFTVNANPFAALSGQEPAVAASGVLRTVAITLTKISNDLRWMNSGPLAGLAEIVLPALQPGSSIMPAKVNPVVPEAVVMACAQVIGNDATISLAAQAGSFQLNTMLPVIAYDLLQSIELLAASASLLAEKAIRQFTVNEEAMRERLGRNPILATALAPRIGYERAAEIAKQAATEGRTVRDVAGEMTDIPDSELDQLLDPKNMTEGGVQQDS